METVQITLFHNALAEWKKSRTIGSTFCISYNKDRFNYLVQHQLVEEESDILQPWLLKPLQGNCVKDKWTWEITCKHMGEFTCSYIKGMNRCLSNFRTFDRVNLDFLIYGKSSVNFKCYDLSMPITPDKAHFFTTGCFCSLVSFGMVIVGKTEFFIDNKNFDYSYICSVPIENHQFKCIEGETYYLPSMRLLFVDRKDKAFYVLFDTTYKIYLFEFTSNTAKCLINRPKVPVNPYTNHPESIDKIDRQYECYFGLIDNKRVFSLHMGCIYILERRTMKTLAGPVAAEFFNVVVAQGYTAKSDLISIGVGSIIQLYEDYMDLSDYHLKYLEQVVIKDFRTPVADVFMQQRTRTHYP